ncbi:hypothetical protein [Actinoplanes sp. NBRC 101535]|uniref:hypothetical protein n=1 Tax=Actinoplanes sp. NBRC 101535 TaxID=3032196 RepID=UPI00249FD41F|nr:hypothetical protein [Actinoplanes sp. NBRC 101535]GLY03936.1 hypothetical protein Acsp01_43150 [Actinoplanes sp. NBRC 101535]
MRTPLQGGLLPAQGGAGPVVEIACDESGFSGTNLLGSAAPVVTHASVDLSRAEAAALITELRSGFRFSPHELKSGRLLRRPDAGEALAWLRDSLAGRAHVHVIDKRFFLVTRVVDLLLGEPSYASGIRLPPALAPAAVALHEARPAAPEDWDAFLAAFAAMVRVKRRRPAAEVLHRFLAARDTLAGHELGDPARAVLAGLRPDRVRVMLARVDAGDPAVPPPLEPMLPALAETVLFWSCGGRRVLVVHDEQSALTTGRLSRLRDALAGGTGESPLAGLVMTDSRDDPRVQIADLLAGVARRTPAEMNLAERPLNDPGTIV